jgi:parallel beta-helix repeat protein
MFSVQPVKGEWTGTVYIRADGSIDPPDAPVLRHGDVYKLQADIVSPSDQHGIVIQKSNIIFDGSCHTIYGQGKSGYGWNGIDVRYVNNVTIKNIKITKFQCAIFLGESYIIKIINNTLIECYGYGVYGFPASFCSILNNTFNGIYGFGVILYSTINNTVSLNAIYADYGVCINGKNSVVSENIIDAFYSGITVNGDNNIVANNSIFDTEYCIRLSGYNNSIVYNRIEQKGLWTVRYGMWVGGGGYNVISENNLVNMIWDSAIYLLQTSNNKIIKNRIVDSWYAIYAYESSNNIISCNTFERSHVYGLYLKYSHSNSIYHNNFINSECFLNQSLYNIWDYGYPSGGNYWNSYTGVDFYSGPYQNETGSDGIGDAPFFIDTNNIDRYPLMHPWSSLPVHDIATGIGYISIQEAISASETLSGHTIFVEAGEYHENVVINKSISLIGENKETTSVNGDPRETVFDIKADNVLLKGFTIQNGAKGVYVNECSNVTILDNVVMNNTDGIFVSWAVNCFIAENEVAYNRRFGIWIIWSSGNVLKNNRLSENVYNFGVWGSELAEFLHDIDFSNTINNKPIYYLINERDLLIDPSTVSSVGFLGIINSTDVVIKNLDFRNNIQGILFAYTNYSAIINCTIMNNYNGIDFCSSSHNVISGNIVSDNGIGIEISYPSINDTISTNTIVNNEACGIGLFKASYSELKANNVSGSYFGIFVHTSYFNKLYWNEIQNHFYGISIWSASNNEIFNNNFINNTHHVDSSYSVNIWNKGYPSGGNYWSGYTGADLYHGPYQNITGSDGIGDTSYIIDESNQDKYPLMNPWPSIHEISIINITFSTSTPKVNDTICIYVTVQNLGHFTETFDISLNYTYLFDPLISTQTITIASGETVTLNFTWTPTANGRYEIKAYTNTVPNDINPEDNTKITYIYIGPHGSPGGSSSSSFRFHINLLV